MHYEPVAERPRDVDWGPIIVMVLAIHLVLALILSAFLFG